MSEDGNIKLEVHSLSDMKAGWFIGNFEPAVVRTAHVEVAVKRYPKGFVDEAHYHRISTEITVIVSGRAKFNGQVCDQGSVVLVPPGLTVLFEAIDDVVTTVVKLPSVAADKYLAALQI